MTHIPISIFKKRSDFLRMASSGRKIVTKSCILQIIRQESNASPRLGYTASKRVGGAVERNRTKRRMRAAMQEIGKELPSGIEMVLIGRPETADCDYQTLLRDIRYALRKTAQSKPEVAA